MFYLKANIFIVPQKSSKTTWVHLLVEVKKEETRFAILFNEKSVSAFKNQQIFKRKFLLMFIKREYENLICSSQTLVIIKWLK